MITDTLAEQILTVRASGKYNMFDTVGIQREAHELGFYELVIFLEEHKDAYTHFIISGERI